MTRAHAVPILLVLLAAPVSSAPRRATAPSPRAALETVAATYAGLRSYRIEGVMRMTVSGGPFNDSLLAPLRLLARRPDHMFSDVRNPMQPMLQVADGESLWTYSPAMGQYVVQSQARLRSNPEDSAALVRALDPEGDYAQLARNVSAVRALGRDTLHLAKGVITCERYEIDSPQDTTRGPGVTIWPRVVWVDPLTHLVRFDSVRTDLQHPQYGQMTTVQTTRFVVAESNAAIADSEFRFVAPAGARRVRRMIATSPQHADLEGTPAEDFTLADLDGKSVALSSLKGQVVVLDFWATWCGPCRGWMPIVERVHRELRDRGLRLLAVNLREPEPKVRDYLAKSKLDVSVLLDRDGAVGGKFRVTSIPLTVVVGRDGRIVRVLLGLHSEEDLRAAIAEAGIE